MTPNELQVKWENWCKAVFTLPCHPMDTETAHAFVTVSVMEMSGQELHGTEAIPIYRIFESHARRIGLRASKGAIAFMAAYLSDGSPGMCVMYAHALRYWQLKKGGEVNMAALGKEIFAFGFPAKEDMQKAWDVQKGGADSGYDNLLDAVPPYETLVST